MTVKAVVVVDTVTSDAGTHKPKATATTEGTTESSLTVWESAEGIRAGVWEVTPGTFASTRPDYHETCQIVSGRATITEPDGTQFEIGPGSLFITPEGWEGTWEVHETLRKSWVVIPFAALANPVRQGE